MKSLDFLIAGYALARRVAILSADTDFVLMRRAGIPLLLVGA